MVKKFNSATNNFDLQQDVNELSRGLAGSGITFKTRSASHPGTFPIDSSNTIEFNSLGIPVNGSNVPTSANIIYITKSDTDFAVTVTLTGKVQIWKKGEAQWDALAHQ